MQLGFDFGFKKDVLKPENCLVAGLKRKAYYTHEEASQFLGQTPGSEPAQDSASGRRGSKMSKTKKNKAKFYGVEVRNCAGTTIYAMSTPFTSKKEAFEAAQKGFKWFALNPNIDDIVECCQDED